MASGHGFIGSHLQPFTELLPLRTTTFAGTDLAVLATMMQADPDTVKDGPDPEENLWLPAGYTYFGQFVDHDLTFDSTSSLNPADRPPQGSHVPSNLRTTAIRPGQRVRRRPRCAAVHVWVGRRLAADGHQ